MSEDLSRPQVLQKLYELMQRVNAFDDLDEVLDAIALGVTEVLGFGVAAISRIEGDTLVMTSVAAPADVREQLLGHRTSVASVGDELDLADQWGVLRFIPHDRLPAPLEEAAWVPDMEPSSAPGAWHPLDTLYAPLWSATGSLLGIMSVDLPTNGLVPSQPDRELLEMFVVQAGLAMGNAQQREMLATTVRMGEMLRALSSASRMVDLAQILSDAGRCVAEGFGTERVRIRCFPSGVDQVEHSYAYPDSDVASTVLVGQATKVAETAALAGRPVLVVAADLFPLDDETRVILEDMQVVNGLTEPTLLVVPIGGPREVTGYLVVAREAKGPEWSEEELLAAMEVGRTLGRVVLDVRLFEREHRLVDELRELDRYREEMIATISHELKTPLTSIMGHVELLEDLDSGVSSVEAISRNTRRLDRLVNDLLDYSALQEPRTAQRTPVDLRPLVSAAIETFTAHAERSGVLLHVATGPDPLMVPADAAELGTVIDNLLSNAIKYTRSGGDVRLSLEHDGAQAVLSCTDTGLGISRADQLRLFTAFHRSSNPEALALPGSGLGLAIAQRIAHLHRGEITVTSRIGSGSTFELRLPIATS